MEDHQASAWCLDLRPLESHSCSVITHYYDGILWEEKRTVVRFFGFCLFFNLHPRIFVHCFQRGSGVEVGDAGGERGRDIDWLPPIHPLTRELNPQPGYVP